jgi:hypothetical protein
MDSHDEEQDDLIAGTDDSDDEFSGTNIAGENDLRFNDQTSGNLTLDAKSFTNKLKKRGVVYMSRVPPFMKPNKARYRLISVASAFSQQDNLSIFLITTVHISFRSLFSQLPFCISQDDV